MTHQKRSEGVRPLNGPTSRVRTTGRPDSAALSRKVVTTPIAEPTWLTNAALILGIVALVAIVLMVAYSTGWLR